MKRRTDIIVIYIGWVLFACMEGVREAGLFAHGGYLIEWPYNIHSFFAPVRGLVFASCVYGFIRAGYRGLFPFLVSLFLCFSFWHDGIYYETRSFLDFPAYHFFSKSQTTTAVHSYGAWVRILGKLSSLAIAWYVWRKNKITTDKNPLIDYII